MKQLLILIILIFFPLIKTISQLPKDNETNKITYKDVIYEKEGSPTKKQLYTRAKLWMITNYVSGENPLSFYDENAGVIIANGSFNANYKIEAALNKDRCTYNVRYVIKISVREGRYKYEITSFTFELYSWTITDDEGNIIPIGKTTRYSLDEYIPNCTKYRDWLYSKSVKQNALNGFYIQIDSEIKDKISSLIKAMKESVIDDNDDW